MTLRYSNAYKAEVFNTGMNNRVSLFIAGCQKTGSTWLYKCFKEHPEIFVPDKDALHYFTINHDLGDDWYHQWYSRVSKGQVLCDGTPSYIRDPKAAERIYRYNPEAKLIFVLRNPIERAFSHYWHMKRKGLVSYSFDDMLNYNEVGNIDLYQMWYGSSEYSSLLEPFLKVFPNHQIHIALFDELKTEPSKFLKEILKFAKVDENFEPSVLGKKVNTGDRGVVAKKQESWLKRFFSKPANTVQVDEYKRGMNPKLEKRLLNKFILDIERLEQLIDQDLTQWKVGSNGQ